MVDIIKELERIGSEAFHDDKRSGTYHVINDIIIPRIKERDAKIKELELANKEWEKVSEEWT